VERSSIPLEKKGEKRSRVSDSKSELEFLLLRIMEKYPRLPGNNETQNSLKGVLLGILLDQK
jgi:hypothetical protein